MVTGLAREFAAAGITANTVAPCYVRTPELAELFESGQAPPRLERVVEQATAIVPIGRPGDPAEIAAAMSLSPRMSRTGSHCRGVAAAAINRSAAARRALVVRVMSLVLQVVDDGGVSPCCCRR